METLRLINIEAFVTDLQNTKEKVRQNAISILPQAGQMLERSIEPFVPVDTHFLESSYQQIVIVNGLNMQLEISYYAGDSPTSRGYDYSVIQHEVAFNHPKKGTDHYLVKGFAVGGEGAIRLIENGLLVGL